MAFGSSPGGYALQALANVLSGTGQGSIAAEHVGQAQQALNQRQQALDQQQSDVPTLFKALGMAAPEGVGKMPRQDAELVLKTAAARQQQQQQRQGAETFASQLDKRQVPVDPNTLGMAAPGATQGFSQADPRAKLAAGLIRAQGAVTPADVNHLMEMLGQKQQPPQQPHIVPRGAQGYVVGNQYTALPQAQGGSPPGPAPFGYVQEPKVDQYGMPSYSAPRPMNAMEHFVASQDPSLDPTTRSRHLQASNYGKLVPVTEGGMAVGGGNVAQGIQPTPGGGAGGPQPIIGRGMVQAPQKPPGEKEVGNLIDTDTMIKQIRDLRTNLQDPEVSGVMGSASMNPMGAIKRRGAEPMKLPVVGLDVGSRNTLSDKQAAATAAIDLIRVQTQKAMEGLRPNSMYMQMLSGALPTANDPNLDAKLAQLEKIMSDKRFITEVTESRLNRNAPPSAVPRANPNQNSPQTKGAGGWKIELVQ